MELIIRNRDVILGNKDLIDFYFLKKFPAFVSCINQEIKKDILENINSKTFFCEKS